MKERAPKNSPERSPIMNRRLFLRGAGAVVGSYLLGACDNNNPTVSSSLPAIERSAPSAPDTTTTDVIGTIPEQSTTFTTQPSVPEISHSSTTLPEVISEEAFIDIATLVDGQKLFDQRVVQPDGTLLLDLPVFASFMNSTAIDAKILDGQGVLLEVVKHSVTRNLIGQDPLFPTEQALPGEVGRVHTFAHRATKVDADRNGDGVGDDGIKEDMYLKLDQIQTGATLILTTPDGKTKTYIAIAGSEMDGYAYNVVHDIYNVSGNPDPAKTSQYRSQETQGQKLYTMVACHPLGSTRDRVYVNWLEV